MNVTGVDTGETIKAVLFLEKELNNQVLGLRHNTDRYISYFQQITKVHIFFNPFSLQNWGKVRTLHHVKELLSFFYCAGLFLHERTASLFITNLTQRYVLFFR
jgi:hypothetical protein